jgi:hypothetical protein
MEKVLGDRGRQHNGEPSDKTKPAVQAAFRRQGWTITEPELTRYANAIGDGTKIAVKVDLR